MVGGAHYLKPSPIFMGEGWVRVFFLKKRSKRGKEEDPHPNLLPRRAGEGLFYLEFFASSSVSRLVSAAAPPEAIADEKSERWTFRLLTPSE